MVYVDIAILKLYINLFADNTFTSAVGVELCSITNIRQQRICHANNHIDFL